MNLGELLTVDEIAAELKVPRATAYDYMRTMRRARVGRHVRVRREDFEQWLAARTIDPADPVPAARARNVPAPRRALVTCGDVAQPLRITQPRKRAAP